MRCGKGRGGLGLLMGWMAVWLTLEAEPLPRATPESQGVTSRAMLGLVEALDRDGGGIHSVMVVRNGRVITEGWWAPYSAATPHELYSLSKSFTAVAVGMAVDEGRLTVTDELVKLFPDDVPEDAGANLKSMRIRDLLRMSTGHQDEVSSAPDRISARSFLAHPVLHKPGTHFRYNTPATFVLSAAVQGRVGMPVQEYLRGRLWEPLGVTGSSWATNSQGISLGGYGLKLRTEDIAKFGQLLLQRGRWGARRLVSEQWVEEATALQTSNGSSPTSDWDQGYGYQFWRCRHGAYRGDGAFGQYCIVLPDRQVVVAITAGVKDMQKVLNLVWEHLLPGLHGEPRSPDVATGGLLEDRLRRLILPMAEGDRNSPTLARVAGKRFGFETNSAGLEWVQLDRRTDGFGWVYQCRVRGVMHRMEAGHRE